MKQIAKLLINYRVYHKDITDKFVQANGLLLKKYELIDKANELKFGYRLMITVLRIRSINKKLNKLEKWQMI